MNSKARKLKEDAAENCQNATSPHMTESDLNFEMFPGQALHRDAACLLEKSGFHAEAADSYEEAGDFLRCLRCLEAHVAQVSERQSDSISEGSGDHA